MRPQVSTRLRIHLADTALRDAEPEGKVLTGDHRVVGDEVERPLLRWTVKGGAVSTIRSRRGIEARFRLGDSVRSLPPGLP